MEPFDLIKKKGRKNYLSEKKVLTRRKVFGIISLLPRERADAGVVQWLESQPSKLVVWVRFPSPAPFFYSKMEKDTRQ